MSALTGLGLTAFGAEGEDFDPVLHEAVQHEGDGGEGSKPVIGTVMRAGLQTGRQRAAARAGRRRRHGRGRRTAGDPGETGAQAEQPDTDDNADASGE